MGEIRGYIKAKEEFERDEINGSSVETKGGEGLCNYRSNLVPPKRNFRCH